MIVQLTSPLPLTTPRGPAWCYFLIDYGIDHHLMFVCFLTATGECWTFPGPTCRLEKNITSGMNLGPAPQV